MLFRTLVSLLLGWAVAVVTARYLPGNNAVVPYCGAGVIFGTLVYNLKILPGKTWLEMMFYTALFCLPSAYYVQPTWPVSNPQWYGNLAVGYAAFWVGELVGLLTSSFFDKTAF